MWEGQILSVKIEYVKHIAHACKRNPWDMLNFRCLRNAFIWDIYVGIIIHGNSFLMDSFL